MTDIMSDRLLRLSQVLEIAGLRRLWSTASCGKASFRSRASPAGSRRGGSRARFKLGVSESYRTA